MTLINELTALLAGGKSAWRSELEKHWSTLEELYAVALYRGESLDTLRVDRNPEIRTAISELGRLIDKITPIAGMEFDSVITDRRPSGFEVRLENGVLGFLENTSNQRWVEGHDLEVGDSVTVVVVDAGRIPVGVSALTLDLERASEVREEWA
ncbi:hypothetical protein KO481_30130 [Nocardia sp. NEAU-G5]|uniref:S1 motif domain-containing protein n=1 Tax=Nocardia albiluteola TaxID=2842303 RepID=A0ABS6B8L3_9NOCA|nr:hypothetical protein [Nocardia albiluteola]MBU3065771.1 hypothetical protein [Nocardia albiluteola]